MSDDQDMTDDTLEKAEKLAPVCDNIVQPFQLEISALRGREVRLGSVLDDILGPHDYPLPVAHLVAETIMVTLLLSSMLKYEGIFTLQASGDGPIKMLVADVTSDGVVRGCASYDPERLEHAREQLGALKTTESAQNHLAQYLGKGHIAFTVDQAGGGAADRYQGIVELKGSSMVDCVQHYFQQSEQIGTGIKMAVGRRGEHWRAGAIMLQHMPEDQKNPQAGAGNMREDDWRRAMILLDTCTETELLDPKLHRNDLLLRLFHEESVRVYDALPMRQGCRCNPQKVEKILRQMPEDELEYMAEEGVISMHCEFCASDYTFDLATLDKSEGAVVDKL